MTSFLRAAALSAGLLPALVCAPSVAAERTLFEMVKDWEIERTVGDTSANPCLMSKTYKDRDDNNAINGIVFALDGSNTALALVYQGWEWEKDETVKATLLAGKKVLKTKVSWTGDEQTLAASLPDSIVPDLLAAKTLVLRFDDGDADFDLAGFPQAYESLRRCDATPVKAPAPTAAAPSTPPPAAAPAPATPPAPPPTPPAVAAAPAPAPQPALPSQERMQVYGFGLMLQKALKECDIASTSKQRSGVDAKVASMQAEMAPIEAALRDAMKADPARCPPETDTAKFQAVIADYIDLSPEAFSAAMDKRTADEAAKKAEAAKTEAPKVEAPKTEAPKNEAPAKAEAPRAEEKVEAPKAETPTPDAPKTEAPKVETPKTEVPTATEAPKP